MKHFVYIIHSSKVGSYYKGYSIRPFHRLREHNEDSSRYTATKGPWKLVYLQSFPDKKEALIRERKLKKYSKDQILRLVRTPLNEITKFKRDSSSKED